MKAAFLGNSEKNIQSVYAEESVHALSGMFDFYEGVYTKETAQQIPDVECIFSTWGMPVFTEEEIKAFFPRLKVLFYGAGSVQAFARPFLNCGISVVSAWMANSVPVQEYTVAQILLANKGFFGTLNLYKKTSSREAVSPFWGNYDAKVGLLGLGAIGGGVAERLKPYHLAVLAYDPFCSEEKAAALGVELVPMETIFRECHVISNHMANLSQTVNILDYSLFSRMQKNAVFLNTGRGAQVVEEDLIRALLEEPSRVAVLDVTRDEPPKKDSPLYTLENVFLTPHIAGSLGNECRRMGAYMVEEARLFLEGKPLRYKVTAEMLSTMA